MEFASTFKQHCSLRPVAVLLVALAALFPLTDRTDAAQETVIDIRETAEGARLIPIVMDGYSGEVAAVLRFDLEICGFEFVPAERATYQLTGKNTEQVEGRLIERITRQQKVGIAYSRGTPRQQAHALADEVVRAVTGAPGLAGTRIAYKRESSKRSEIYVADFDGANPVAVTQDGAVVAAPCLAPGLRTLFYTSYKSGFPDVYSHELSTGARRPIARYPGLNTGAAVSPNGQRVALILSKNGSPDLYVCNTDGSSLAQLTRTKEDESSPCWSPDSRTIAFVSRRTGFPSLHTIAASGGEVRPVRVTGVRSLTEPSWSPDGKFILYTAMRGEFQIGIVPASGGEGKDLVAGEDPCWAPNSRTAIFTRRTKGGRVLSLLDVPTKRVKDVQQISGSCSQPSWAK